MFSVGGDVGKCSGNAIISDMAFHYDIIVFGGGIAGLYTANRLRRAGFNLILIEKDTLGGVQTLASQGMIHGGQKYGLGGSVTGHSQSMAAMPARWDACFAGAGDVDLSGVHFLSKTQLMFPAASLMSVAMAHAAVTTANRPSRKLAPEQFPDILKREPVFEMQEQVLDAKSLVEALAKNLSGRIFHGELTEVKSDGQVSVSGIAMQAKHMIFAAGAGNEFALNLCNVTGRHTQRRPLRQFMVKTLSNALYGHGTSVGVKPRVTITSHPIGAGEYVWYLGGNIAESSVGMPENEALDFARSEMSAIFPDIDWRRKEWASFTIDRAEPFDESGRLPAGACIQAHGSNLFAWPTKMTLVPELSDQILEWIRVQELLPSAETETPALPVPIVGQYPWEGATWQKP